MDGKVIIFTAFSGYDSQCLAMERLKRTHGVDYELVGCYHSAAYIDTRTFASKEELLNSL